MGLLLAVLVGAQEPPRSEAATDVVAVDYVSHGVLSRFFQFDQGFDVYDSSVMAGRLPRNISTAREVTVFGAEAARLELFGSLSGQDLRGVDQALGITLDLP